MSSYPQGRQIEEYAFRTKSNLLWIERITALETGLTDKEKTAFEVTQLINSLMGLIVAPQQALYKKYPVKFSTKRMNDLLDWCRLNCEYRNTYSICFCPKKGHEKDTLNLFIKHIRNAVSHMSLEDGKNAKPPFFQPIGDSIITHIFFRDSWETKCKGCKKEDCSSRSNDFIQEFEIKIPITGDFENKTTKILKELIIGISDEIILTAKNLFEGNEIQES